MVTFLLKEMRSGGNGSVDIPVCTSDCTPQQAYNAKADDGYVSHWS